MRSGKNRSLTKCWCSN